MTKRHLTKTERDVAVFALRYALPRHTGALGEVIAEVKPYIDDFASWEIVDMMRDCRMYYPTADFGGDVCDQPKVDAWYTYLDGVLADRKGKENREMRRKGEPFV